MSHPRLGQHFLQNDGVLNSIIGAINASGQETIFEIGTGTGVLTKKLARTKNKVISIEKDFYLFNQAAQWSRLYPNLTILNGDILRLDLVKYVSEPWVMVGNIPYYITGKLLRLIIEKWPRPRAIVLMIQKEVAERLTDKGRFSKLSVFARLYADITVVRHVPPTAFKPEPKVWSSIIKLEPRQAILIELNDPDFQALIAKAFSSPRKYLANNLKTIYPGDLITKAFEQLKIDEQIRAESIPPATWIELHRLLNKKIIN